MSCIPRLLELKGDKECLLLNKRAVLENGGNYKGYDWAVTMTENGTRCGYVAISEDHPAYSDKGSDYPDYDVHGGVTFFGSPSRILDDELVGESSCNDKWIGFDAAHAGDGRDLLLAIKYLPNSHADKLLDVFNEVEERVKDKYSFHNYGENDVLRTLDYMEQECKNLIEQLIKVKDAA